MNYKKILTLLFPFFLMVFWSTLAIGSERNVRQITLKDLRPVFMKTLFRLSPWPSKELEVSTLQAYPSRVWVPEGKVSFHVEPPSNSSFLGRVSFLVEIKVNGRITRSVRVCGRVEIYKQVLSFALPLKRGHVIRKDDLVSTRRALSRLGGQVMSDAGKVVGKALKRSVRAGQAVTPGMLEPPIIVKKGDRVTIIAQDSSLLVTVPGEVKQDGARGGFVRVRNVMSHREVVARVLDSKTVKVIF